MYEHLCFVLVLNRGMTLRLVKVLIIKRVMSVQVYTLLIDFSTPNFTHIPSRFGYLSSRESLQYTCIEHNESYAERKTWESLEAPESTLEESLFLKVPAQLQVGHGADLPPCQTRVYFKG